MAASVVFFLQVSSLSQMVRSDDQPKASDPKWTEKSLKRLHYSTSIVEIRSDLNQGHISEALEKSREAIKTAPDQWIAYELQGEAFQAHGQYTEAADSYSLALDRAPDSDKSAIKARLEKCKTATQAKDSK